ncbi:hypothetical protein E2K80_01335 [Rhodophyticola sp. CCM32]|uniref:hypothetical protein n=1 Tax=Rhodophyticola sp. CCM32 TaxID=2916397 RepID=UPI00107FB8EB|nr:hypothetical protein [Rhodophyticola sp. CCM32]QBX99535.1 hypothetical protein E2K80_01335 [Rhodophyticola sp. CCM32]
MIHDRVIEKMFDILEGSFEPSYMDQAALRLLSEACANYARQGFAATPFVELGGGACILATRCGTVKTTTLAMALGASGFQITQHDGFLLVETGDADHSLGQVLSAMAYEEMPDLFTHAPNLVFEKYHPYLTPDLLKLDALSTRVDAGCLQKLCADLQEYTSDRIGLKPS